MKTFEADTVFQVGKESRQQKEWKMIYTMYVFKLRLTLSVYQNPGFVTIASQFPSVRMLAKTEQKFNQDEKFM